MWQYCLLRSRPGTSTIPSPTDSHGKTPHLHTTIHSCCRFIKIGDKECEYNPKFRLILHTKLASPRYQPELQAQATLIDFTVTRDGLEDQLLAAVVSMERPDLEQLKVCGCPPRKGGRNARPLDPSPHSRGGAGAAFPAAGRCGLC